MGSASSSLVTRVARLGSVATGGRAAGYRTHAIWVGMRLCARWEVTHLFSLLRTFFAFLIYKKRAIANAYLGEEPSSPIRRGQCLSGRGVLIYWVNFANII